MNWHTTKGFSQPVLLMAGAVMTFAGGVVGLTTEAHAPASHTVQATNEETVPVIDKTNLTDGYTRFERVTKVREYLKQYDMFAAAYAEEFVKYADKYGIDWRLLPTLAFLESSGFKNLCPGQSYNGFGWASCDVHFDSHEEAIKTISRHLAGKHPDTDDHYKGKTTKEILYTYNPAHVKGISKNYHDNALRIMEEIKAYPAFQ